jgi:hypothetical protein
VDPLILNLLSFSKRDGVVANYLSVFIDSVCVFGDETEVFFMDCICSGTVGVGFNF